MVYYFLTPIIYTDIPRESLYVLFNLILNPLVFTMISTFYISKGGLSTMKAFIVSLSTALVVIIGSRLIHAAVAIKYYIDFSINPWEVAPRNFTMFGGFLVGIVFVYFVCRLTKFNYWKMLDFLTPGWSLGIVFNKTGCFLNGCCFGIPTKLPIGVSYPVDTEPYSYFFDDLINLVGQNGDLSHSIPIHAVQLYEVAIGFFGFLLSAYLIKKNKKPGLVFASFAVMYSFGRFLLNYIRAIPYNLSEAKSFLPYLYLMVFFLALTIFISKLKNNKE